MAALSSSVIAGVRTVERTRLGVGFFFKVGCVGSLVTFLLALDRVVGGIETEPKV